ncbi:Cationic amino acid transporter 2 [Nymphaea thermarum]|nr:Cationic amino acid transporter 2 [Nymphaea thermarum]
MGFPEIHGQGWGSWGLHSLVRRKQVDSLRTKSAGTQLAKDLSIVQLIAIGVGATIGAGVYVLVGTVAREHSGPALTISFLIAGIAAALSAFCYAELASRCPSAGSAYHYSYICVGEGIAWIIGWALILEYTVGGSAVARGISPNLALLFGGENSLPVFLARHHIPSFDIVVDPCAAVLVFIVTGLLCLGIKESTFAQSIVTTANVCVMIFVIIAGSVLGFQSGWPGYALSNGYFPFGVNGMLAGSATVFFAYIGFDAVASTAEEVKNPQRDLPLGIGISLSLCCVLYMLVSVVIVGLVPYYAMDPDTPISSAFSSHGMQWAVYIITAGAITALCATLLGSILPQASSSQLRHISLVVIHQLPLQWRNCNLSLTKLCICLRLCSQPRILMAMARDGLLPSFFSDVNERTQVPVKGTLLTGIVAATLAFCMDVSQLAGMVSVGTLLAFTIVAISILILRYVPPDEVPLPSYLQETIDSVSAKYGSQESEEEDLEDDDKICKASQQVSESRACLGGGASVAYPLIEKKYQPEDKSDDQRRRKVAAINITFVCIGALLLTSAASFVSLPGYVRLSVGGVGVVLLCCGLIVLSWIDQDDGRHSFGHSGGFICPFVPLLPVCCILINIYLLVNLGGGTWLRVSSWLVIGVIIYLIYGNGHSSLADAVYVPAAHVDEIYRSSSRFVE